MDKEIIKKYIGHLIFFNLKNGLKYKIKLCPEYLNGDCLSFTGKFGEPIDFDISEISFITISNQENFNDARNT